MKIYAHVFSSFSDIFCKGKYCRDTSTIQLGCICSDSENVSTVSILYCILYRTVYTLHNVHEKFTLEYRCGLIFGWKHGNHGLIRLFSFLWHAESSGVLDKGVQLVLPPLHLGHRALGGPNMLHCCQDTAKIFFANPALLEDPGKDFPQISIIIPLIQEKYRIAYYGVRTLFFFFGGGGFLGRGILGENLHKKNESSIKYFFLIMQLFRHFLLNVRRGLA